MQQRRLVVYYTLDTGPDSSLAYYRCTTCPLVVHHWYLNQHAIAAHWQSFTACSPMASMRIGSKRCSAALPAPPIRKNWGGKGLQGPLRGLQQGFPGRKPRADGVGEGWEPLFYPIIDLIIRCFGPFRPNKLLKRSDY